MKTWHIISSGKVVSRHKNFYLAQCATENHLKKGKINNDYEILPIEFMTRKEQYEKIKNETKRS